MSDNSDPGAIQEFPISPAPEKLAGAFGSVAAPRSSRNLWVSLLVGILCLLAYNANLRSIGSGDTYPARYLPLAIWRYHTLLLDPVFEVTAQGRRKTAYWMIHGRSGHAISLYPVIVPVAVAPLYLPAIVYLNSRGWDRSEMERVARIMEKLSASLLAAISSALMYLLLRRRTDSVTAILLTLAFAFGTTTWVISSQALWQHTLGELLIIGMLLLLTGPRTPGAALAAGFLCGLIACNRPPDSILAVAFGIYGISWAKRLTPLLVGAGAVSAGLVVAYNLVAAGNVGGAYLLVGKASFFQHDLLSGLAGLLISPTRGLFVFSPFLLFLPFCLPQVLRARGTRGLTVAIGIAALLQLLVYAKADWRQGFSWGPRWLTDLVPVLVWMLPPVVDALRTAGRIAFVLACGFAVGIQAVGAFWYTGASDAAIFASAAGPNTMRAAWNVRNTPFIAELRHPPAPFELFTQVGGFLDEAPSEGEIRDVAIGDEIDLAGWALADGHSPREVVALLDGELVASTESFFARPDVTSSLGAASPSGWRIQLRPHNLSTGKHVVSVAVRAYEGGILYYLAERRFVMLAAKDSDSSQIAELQHGLTRSELRFDVRGFLDVAPSEGEVRDAATGSEIDLAGWALADGNSPWEVMALLDGEPAASTGSFFARPDVTRTLGATSPSGWRIELRSRDLTPGKHVLAIVVRPYEGGDLYKIADRRFIMLAANDSAASQGTPAKTGPGVDAMSEGLAASARRAAAALSSRQQAPGYWLTSFTNVTRFQHPGLEMNTFLTSLMVDILDPVAAEAGLGESLKRARNHLSSQIEAGGVVRYHGRPDAPTIGTLGCAITPDADDTALVWRIAPGAHPQLLRAALATLDQYRTPEGLYRTWLAPRDAYQCIDPGKDPNPADVAIQMHVLMLLAQANPPAARDLCRALGRSISEDRIWVYYHATPLVPILRQADLQKYGCVLRLPPSRLRTALPGQEVWVAATQMLQRIQGAAGSIPTSAEVLELLRNLSKNEFSSLRTSPPLLYHNDLTASVRRFYWSQDVGYALWLRLYFENTRHRSLHHIAKP